MKTRKAFSIVSVIAVMVMASVFVAGTASAAPAGGSITIKSQDCCNSGMIVVDSAMAAQAGWLGIFRNSDGSVGSLVGYAPVMQGQNGQLTVDVNSNRIGSAPTLWAGFLVDESGTGFFDPSTVALAPGTPLVAFGTQAAAPAAMALAAAPSVPTTGGIPAPVGPLANKISIKSQDCCNSGMIVVDSATAAQAGWLGIFKSADGSIGSLVGYVPVMQGQNGQLSVDVNSNRIGSAATLWAGLLVDESGTGFFDPSTVALAPGTSLIAFGTQAAAPAAMALATAPSVPTTGGASAPAGPVANKISIKSQDCCDTGMVVVGSATAAQDGWLGIFRDSSGSTSSLVGFVPVVKGQNGQLTVDVDSKRIGSAPTLWAGFLVDTTGASTNSPNFLFNIANLALAPNSSLVAFGTSASGQ